MTSHHPFSAPYAPTEQPEDVYTVLGRLVVAAQEMSARAEGFNVSGVYFWETNREAIERLDAAIDAGEAILADDGAKP
jgi:hypothetical protein